MTDPVSLTPDDPPPPAQAWAGLLLQVGNQVADRQAAAADRRRERQQPIRGPRYASGTVPASGALVLDLGMPAMGRRWTVRHIALSDAASVRAATTGTADVYIGNPAAYGPSGWRWPFNSLPAAQGYTSEVLVVTPTDHLFVVVQGATAGQVLQARASVLDYPADLPKAVQAL